jgi:hypothetical protein
MSVKWILAEIERELKTYKNEETFVILSRLQQLAKEEYENKEKYNGWTNYETWDVALWIDNEQGSYNYWRDRAKEILDSEQIDENSSDELINQSKENSRYALAEELKDYFEDNNPLADQANTYTDLLRAALSEVNWNEIARHMFFVLERRNK